MRVHITGSGGFIAGHLTRELRRQAFDVTGTDVSHAYSPGAILREYRPDVVVHAGALVGRVRGVALEAIDLNVRSTLQLAHECSLLGVPLLYLSTSEVYGPAWPALGSPWGDPARESEPLTRLPHNLYGLTKLWGEQACELELDWELLTIARLSMPYGPGHPPGVGRAALTNFLHAAMRGDPLEVHRGARRSWTWVGDTARALALLISREQRGVWNVGRDDNELTMMQVAELAVELADSSSPIIEVDPPPGFTLVKRLDCTRLRALGWEPEVELDEGARRVLEWLRELYR